MSQRSTKNNGDSLELVEALQHRISQYEGLIQEMVDNSKKIGIVKAGPFNEEGKVFYRVSSGSDDLMLVHSSDEVIEKDSEVVFTDNYIARVLPKPLVIKKETPDFKRIDWGDVGGLKSQVDEIRKHIEGPIKNSKLYREFGIEPSKGALLYGPPGCGKTLISRVIASKIIDAKKGNADSFVYIKGPEILNHYVGATEEKIRSIFEQCRKNAIATGTRSVIFIDEAEAILSRRGSGISSDVNNTIVPQFLAEMDGFDQNSPFVLLSTNLPNALDPAVVREGRIDIKVEIKRPTIEDAVEIFGIHMKNVKCHDSVHELSEKGAEHLYSFGLGVSGSMIKTIVNSATQESLHRHLEGDKRKGLTIDALLHSIEKVANSQIQ
jgi:proteasome-associated ATPase